MMFYGYTKYIYSSCLNTQICLQIVKFIML